MVTLLSLSDDVLRDILLRLDSIPEIVRSACTSRRMYILVASWRDFGYSFRRRCPPLLLGLFFDPMSPDSPAIPSFAPSRRDDPDLVAALLAGDFFLTPLQVSPRVPPHSWTVQDIRCGRLLLLNRIERLLVVINPMARRLRRRRRREGFFDLNRFAVAHGGGAGFDFDAWSAHLICDEEEPAKFRICCLAFDASVPRVWIAIFSSETNANVWFATASAWLNLDAPVPGGLERGMRAGRFIYWPYRNQSHVVIMDTRLQLPIVQPYLQEIPPSLPESIPPSQHGGFPSYLLGETRGGELCVVYVQGLRVNVKLGGEHGDVRARPWVRERVFNLHGEFPAQEDVQLELQTITDGLVYLTTSRMFHDSHHSCWFATLCLETRRVERLFRGVYCAAFKPYHLWPG